MTLAYLGYGTEGIFSTMWMLEEEAVRPHLATVTLAPEQVLPHGVVILADLIHDELAAYIGNFCGSDFIWEVTETAPLVFSVPFPSAELLRECSHDFISCPINQFRISVHAAEAEPDPVPPLEKVWVLVYGFPRGGRSASWGGKFAHILKAISEPVGKLVTADLASFEDDGPARIKILSPSPSKIDGMSLIFYFDTKGRCLTFELESPVPEDRLRLAPVASMPCDEGKDGDGGPSGESSFCEEDGDVGVPLAPSDGRRSPGSTGGGSSEVATDSGIVFRGEKGPILEKISAICTKEKLEGALVESRACAARGEPSSLEPTDPGHRETRDGTAPSKVTMAGTSLSVPSSVRVLRGHPPTRLNPTEHRLEVRGSRSSWEVIIVYGPADHGRFADFLAELENKVERCTNTVVVADDFNLIRRYSLEASLMDIFKSEELFWKRRGVQNWLLKGDANTAYFQAIANGRRRKCVIPFLSDVDVLLESPEDISSISTPFIRSCSRLSRVDAPPYVRTSGRLLHR
ncbi:putative NOT transcription complex subunit VIP2 [Hordeum vulgare]|nr:putative NOT transcription complex subunit VIP2 [Hordeum vulgare]